MRVRGRFLPLFLAFSVLTEAGREVVVVEVVIEASGCDCVSDVD